jgi:hypothetical protein
MALRAILNIQTRQRKRVSKGGLRVIQGGGGLAWAGPTGCGAVIDRPYSLGQFTVGALQERPRSSRWAKPHWKVPGSVSIVSLSESSLQ